ncbi:MAG: hypothetical protein COA58_13670 [Bacteroidetes bacterium]|nr:MAG: hypothetical protein COA58_13670 [Bacteroidota bacterium]
MNRTITNVRLILICVFGLLSYTAQSQDFLINKESTWLYQDNGANLNTYWRDSGFAAGSFKTGQGPLGMGGVTGAILNTTITKRLTTYYIKTFTLSDPTYTTLYVNMMCDDGFVLYINEVEALRDNMGSGTITSSSTAITAISSSDEGDYDMYTIPSTLLSNGVNTIAVELHNSSAGSSDLAFDLELSAIDLGDPLVQRLDSWSYHDQGSDLGTSWYSTSYDASSWSEGSAVLGYGTLDGATVATTLSYGSNSSDKYATTYFHKEVTLSNPNYSQLSIGLLADDGAAVYINGKLAFAVDMPSTWDYSSYASSTIGNDDEGDYDYFTVPDTFLVNGLNVFAVEVHQTNATSSDLGFDLEVNGLSGRVVSGKIFLDMDGTGTETPLDVFGSGAVEIRMYNDADSNGVYIDTEIIKSVLTNPFGDYAGFVMQGVRHLAIKLMTEDMDDQVGYTTDTVLTYTLVSGVTDTIFADFGTLGPRSLCLMIADDQSNADKYYMANRISGKNQYISTLSTTLIEALAIRIGMDSMWAFDDGQFGTVDIATGLFTSVGPGIGSGTGILGGSSTSHSFTDVDGLAYDATNDILYGVERRSGNSDLLIAVNRSTGNFIDNFFGSGLDFVEIAGTGIKEDVDDIAFNPNTGQLLAVNNENSGDSTRYISIDPTTGTGTVISIVGVGDFESLGYYNTGELYGTTGVEDAGGYSANTFYQIARTTGIGTKLDSLYSGAIDVEACDCLTGPLENLISGVVFYDEDSSGVFDNSDTLYGSIKVYLYRDANNNGVIDAGDYIIDSTLTDLNTGFYVFITDSLGDFLTTPYIEFTQLAVMNTTTSDSITETATFIMHGDFDGRNDFGFHITAGIPYLPVEWLKIAAVWTKDKDAAITWSTASETNTSHYEVERKTDDSEFTSIGLVDAFGNTNSISKYSLVDFEANIQNSKNIIYRVKQVDFDNAFEYSNSVILTRKPGGLTVTAYPNPITNFVNVEINQKGKYNIIITDVTGHLIVEKTGTNYNSFSPIKIGELNQLRKGLYLVRVTCNGEETVVKLIK